MNISLNYHHLNDLIQGLKTAYRNPGYLAWLRRQKCFSCPAKNDITASHILRGYHGLKNHDWASVPMCGPCHWEYEYSKAKFVRHSNLPLPEDAERYFQRYLKEMDLTDNRKPEQLKSV